ncbi:hypothetical protein AWB61_03925 [Chromobacterium sp. F49]|nr:hypothetical protein Cv017_05675 [Chromobacterium subtsugae]KZE84554.1 hypothetical protein AWB61_03925 [Chromobacterium sp. F49]
MNLNICSVKQQWKFRLQARGNQVLDNFLLPINSHRAPGERLEIQLTRRAFIMKLQRRMYHSFRMNSRANTAFGKNLDRGRSNLACAASAFHIISRAILNHYIAYICQRKKLPQH